MLVHCFICLSARVEFKFEFEFNRLSGVEIEIERSGVRKTQTISNQPNKPTRSAHSFPTGPNLSASPARHLLFFPSPRVQQLARPSIPQPSKLRASPSWLTARATDREWPTGQRCLLPLPSFFPAPSASAPSNPSPARPSLLRGPLQPRRPTGQPENALLLEAPPRADHADRRARAGHTSPRSPVSL